MQQFNIRVYGVLKNMANEVLLSDEMIRGKCYTKFPGGGLEFGEGTRDCLKREFMEELNLHIEVGAHLYTTDFYQPSAFHPHHQIVSIYYWVTALEPITARLSAKPFDFDEAQLETYRQQNETESFRFVHWEQLTEQSVSLPIDKVVVKLIKEKF